MSSKSVPPDAFGRAAREYELGRPEWPEELIDLREAELERELVTDREGWTVAYWTRLR